MILNSSKTHNKIILGLLAGFAVLSLLSFATPANATTPILTCPNGHAIYADYDISPNNRYYFDHGALIWVCDNPNQTLHLHITTPVANGGSATGITIPLNATLTNSSIYVFNIGTLTNVIPGYLYFGTADDNLRPTLKDSSTATSTITIAETGGSGLANLQFIVVPSDDIASLLLTPSPNNQPYKKVIINSGCTDNDHDGICDSWEDNLITVSGGEKKMEINYTQNSVTASYDYFCDPTGATITNSTQPNGTINNPDRVCPGSDKPDVFVEIDYFKRHKPDMTALNDVVNSFNNAPVFTNGLKGIRLHLQVDEELPGHKDSISLPSPGNSAVSDFDALKTNYFGTLNDRTCPVGIPQINCSNYIKNDLTAKRQIFHYALIAHAQSNVPSSSGGSELPGNDMMISLGKFTGGVGSVDQLEGTFMHELGHNFNLYHGGEYTSFTPDSFLNCKPNYLSVMSYTRQTSDYDSQRSLNYSSNQYGSFPLNENGVSESIVLPPSNEKAGQTITWGAIVSSTVHIMHQLLGGATWTDWNGNTIRDGNNVVDNLNFLGTNFIGCDVNSGTSPPPLTTLNDFNDWGNLTYNFKGTSAFYDGAPIIGQDGIPVNVSAQNWINVGKGHLISVGLNPRDEYTPCDSIPRLDYNALQNMKASGHLPPNLVCFVNETGIPLSDTYELRSLHINALSSYLNGTHNPNISNQTRIHAAHTKHLAEDVYGYSQYVLGNLTSLADDISNSTVPPKIKDYVFDSVNSSDVSYQKAFTPAASYPDKVAVVPEFGPIVTLVMIIATMSAIIITRYYRKIF